MLVDELLKGMQSGKQTDLILLDFRKAFDKVVMRNCSLNCITMELMGGWGGGGGYS